jgi:tetratricopeptide (TPR) repeat protein
VVLLAAVLTGCATGSSAYKKGYTAAKVHDWDTAVAHFRTAVQDDPDKPEYRIALERAMMEAALIHASAGKDFEAQGQLDAALREYHRASEYDPSNRQLAARVMDLDRRIAEQIEASRPRPKIDVMRERARRMTPEPTLNPTSREPLDLHFTGSVRTCSSSSRTPPASTSLSPATTGIRRSTRSRSPASRSSRRCSRCCRRTRCSTRC